MMRVIGAAALLAIGGYCAFGTAKTEKKKLTVLEAWIAFLYCVRSQIDCFSLPLPEILKKADPTLLSALGLEEELFSTEQLVDATASILDGESQKLLKSWSKEIGTTYREEQVKRCDYYLRALEVQRDKARQNLPLRIRMLTTIHLCASLGAVILLW